MAISGDILGGCADGAFNKAPETQSPAKGAEPKTANVLGSKYICKKYNDSRGRAKESHCPDSRRHCCDIVKPDNEVCAAKDHTRLQCPFC